VLGDYRVESFTDLLDGSVARSPRSLTDGGRPER
jgi:phosphatidylglycerophosphate synthase